MSEHLKTGETLGVPGGGTALSIADIKTAIGSGTEIPAGAGTTDRRIHFGVTGVADTEAKVKAAHSKKVFEAKGYPGARKPAYRPWPDPSYDGKDAGIPA